MIHAQNRKWYLITTFWRSHQRRIISTFVFGVIANTLTILIPITLGKYFDLLFEFRSHRAAFFDRLPFSFWDNIYEFLGFLTVLILLRFVFYFAQRYHTEVLGEFFVKDLREKLFLQQLNIKSDVYVARGTGRYLLRHSGDLKSIQSYLTKGVIRFSIDVTLLALAFLFLLWLNVQIFAIVFLGLGVTVITVIVLNKILFKISINRRNIRSGILAFVNRQLQAINTIKAFNKVPTEVKKYHRRSEKLLDSGVRFQRIYNLIFTIIPTFFYLMMVLILFVIFKLKNTGTANFDSSSMLAVVFLLLTILPIFRRAIRVNTIWELGNISFEKLGNVFDLESEKGEQNLSEFEFNGGKIEFKNVDFFYEENRPVFENLNFEIFPGKINQIQIKNGGGKSTLIKLLSGLYFPSKGVIEIDGQDIKSVKLKSLRKNITFISSEFPLLGRTVFETISYSRKNEKKKKAELMLDAFQKGVPKDLRLNIMDRVMEGGSNLSKSEVKLLIYVRAALSKKPIIAIEEPLLNLEKMVAKNVIDWLLSQKEKKTIILICQNWKELSILVDNKINVISKYVKDEDSEAVEYR